MKNEIVQNQLARRFALVACPPSWFFWSSTSRQRFAGNSLESAASSRESPRRTALQCVNANAPFAPLQTKRREWNKLLPNLTIFHSSSHHFCSKSPNARTGWSVTSPSPAPCAPRSRGLYRSFQRSWPVEIETHVHRAVSGLVLGFCPSHSGRILFNCSDGSAWESKSRKIDIYWHKKTVNYSNHLNSCYLLPSTYLSLTLICWNVVPCECFHQEPQRWLSLIQELPWLSLTPECVRRLLCKKDSEPGTCSPCRPFPTRQISGSGSNQPDFGAFYFWINPHVSSQECQKKCPNAPVGFVQNGVPPNPLGWLIDFTPLPRIQRASDWQPPKAAIGFTCSCCYVWGIYGNRFYRTKQTTDLLMSIMNLGTRIKEDNWLSMVHSDLSPPSPWCAQVVQHEHLHPEKDAMTRANFKYPSVIKHGNLGNSLSAMNGVWIEWECCL